MKTKLITLVVILAAVLHAQQPEMPRILLEPKPNTQDQYLSLTLPDGTKYTNVKITRGTPLDVRFIHDAGIATLPLAGFPDDIRQRYGYGDAQAVASAMEANAARAAAAQQGAAARLALIKQENAQAAQGQKSAALAARAVRVLIKVRQVTDTGLLVDGSVPGQAAGWQGLIWREGSTDKDAYIHLTGLAEGYVDGDQFTATIVPNGTYSYTTILNTRKTVRQYQVVPAQ